MLKFNKSRLFFCCIGVISLCIGLLIYLFFRENTYIAELVENVIDLSKLRSKMRFLGNDFIKYYLVDYLWALSLCSGLHIIFKPSIKNSIIAVVTVFLYGATYEILQFSNIISGTGDIADIILYLLAALTVNLINLFLIKKG